MKKLFKYASIRSLISDELEAMQDTCTWKDRWETYARIACILL